MPDAAYPHCCSDVARDFVAWPQASNFVCADIITLLFKQALSFFSLSFGHSYPFFASFIFQLNLTAGCLHAIAASLPKPQENKPQRRVLES